MIDIILLLLVGASILFGLMRGLVSTIAGTLAWVLGAWLAFLFGGQAAAWWAGGQAPGIGHHLAGYGSVFVVVMVGVYGLGLLLRTAIRAALLGGIDRMLGGALGLVRGLFLACVLLLVAGFTPLTAEPVWQQSTLRPLLWPGVAWMQSHLPDVLTNPPALDYRAPLALGKAALTGDNAPAGGWLPGTGQAEQHGDDPAATVPGQPAWPTNIEPAPAGPPAPGSPEGNSHGQARPNSL